MVYSDEQLKKIQKTGMFNYPARKVANVIELELDKIEQFIRDFNDPDSTVAKAYQRGVDLYDFAMDGSLFKQAAGGNMKAYEALQHRMETTARQKEYDEEDRK